VLQALVLDAADLLFRDAEMAGDDRPRAGHRQALVLRLHQRREDRLAALNKYAKRFQEESEHGAPHTAP
jgi:hypothetical protein